ncbi:MAG: phosphoglycerate kinase [Pseudomonadota bacterium]
MDSFKTLDDIIFSGKKVLVRVDTNVPMNNGIVSDDTRLRHIVPTIEDLTKKGAAVILVAHFGRPGGKVNPDLTLRPVAKHLAHILGRDVNFVDDVIGEKARKAVSALEAGQILMLENIRFEAGEEKNDRMTAQALADLADIYVNDAFSAAHRAHASTEGITHFLPSAVGRGMQAEIEALNNALSTPKRAVAAVVGGAKVSTKIDLLENLIEKVDVLVIGGGMANTFLMARGFDVGKSLCEKDLLTTAKRIEERALHLGKQIILPVDVVVASEFKQGADHRSCRPEDVQPDEMIVDAGPETTQLLQQLFASMKTILWNGPFGAFELPPFDTATVKAAQIVADLTQKKIVTSIAGGGDTVSALNHAGVSEKFTYVSTAGGAFLEWIEGKSLPGVEALKQLETL